MQGRADNTEFMSKYGLNWFDILCILGLIGGFFHGRKKGMSMEFMPMLQFLTIAGLAGWYHRDVAQLAARYTKWSPLVNSYVSYFIIALVICAIFGKPKTIIAEKLLEKGTFGTMEYYFGMVAGMIAAASLIFIFMALLHGQTIGEKQYLEREKKQIDNFGQSFFPSIAKIQRSVFQQSMAGKWLKDLARPFFIDPGIGKKTNPSDKSETYRNQKEREMEELLGGPKK